MDIDNLIALGAAVISLIAMSVAIWQAREARGSRHAAEQQAVSAKTAADASWEQVAIMREDLDHKKQVDHEANVPLLQLKWRERSIPEGDRSGGWEEFRIRYIEGPIELDKVTLNIQSTTTVDLLDRGTVDGERATQLEFEKLTRGDEHAFLCHMLVGYGKVVLRTEIRANGLHWPVSLRADVPFRRASLA